MISALILGIALGGAGAVSPAQSEGSVADLVRTACVDTGMRREAFEAMAQSRHWQRIEAASEDAGEAGWTLHYRAGRMSVMLSMMPVDGPADPALASMCAVMAPRPAADWRSGVETLASELRLAKDPEILGAPGTDQLSWSKFGEFTLSASYAPSNQSLAVTLSRQIITRTTQNRPSGN